MRYRNDVNVPLNYSDSGGPWVEPGETFEHDGMPPGQRESHLRSGFISVVTEAAPALIEEVHRHETRAVIDALQAAPGRRPAVDE